MEEQEGCVRIDASVRIDKKGRQYCQRGRNTLHRIACHCLNVTRSFPAISRQGNQILHIHYLSPQQPSDQLREESSIRHGYLLTASVSKSITFGPQYVPFARAPLATLQFLLNQAQRRFHGILISRFLH
jgi:hypothetical protein